MSTDINNLVDDPKLKWILTSPNFKEHNDGRERALFLLIHVLKHKYEKDELVSYLQNWYRYVGGNKLNPYQIKGKVYYQWDRNYSFGESYLNELLESIGVQKEAI
jgi:hypothetical protein